MTTAYLYNQIYMMHDTGQGHPEKPERIEAINKAIMSAPFYARLLKITPSLPEMKYIEMIHAKSYIQRAEQEIKAGISYLDSMDTAVCTSSYDVALQAVGGGLAICDAIIEGRARNGFCAIRPPGHHAEWDYAAGFCIFNNIAIAARYLQAKHQIGKIAIVDWDVHHGNGTQHSFEMDNTIFYISLHQYPHYPGSGSASETGSGAGKGFTLNIPMQAGSGDAEYNRAFKETIIPSLHAFKPEIILISAGFDAHRNDPLSSIRLYSESYTEYTRMLMAVADAHCKGRLIAFLEGGYNLQSLSESVTKMIGALVMTKEGAE
jgi:acetoin utilization deacetylase AcuC-like enzyme